MSYKCNHCGYECEELPTFTQYHDYGSTVVGETLLNDMCSCGGDMVEGDYCERCGRFSDDIHAGLCECCYSDMYDD